DIVTLLHEECGSDGAVHPAAHTQNDAVSRHLKGCIKRSGTGPGSTDGRNEGKAQEAYASCAPRTRSRWAERSWTFGRSWRSSSIHLSTQILAPMSQDP